MILNTKNYESQFRFFINSFDAAVPTQDKTMKKGHISKTLAIVEPIIPVFEQPYKGFLQF